VFQYSLSILHTLLRPQEAGRRRKAEGVTFVQENSPKDRRKPGDRRINEDEIGFLLPKTGEHRQNALPTYLIHRHIHT
jgi:hypothetical protein